MAGYAVTHWDDAYENGAHIVDSAGFVEQWRTRAEQYRQSAAHELDVAYGAEERARYDLFLPAAASAGLLVFVHGGYWQRLDKSYWSHLAQGAVDNGWTVMMPSYTLCPAIAISGIERMIGDAITHAAARVEGPIVLTGHSAGGHLVAAMMCEDTPLSPQVLSRVQHTLPISALADLRPLLNTRLNDALQLDHASATHSSPALKLPVANTRITAWVGAAERSEFKRQNALLANIWRGLGAWTDVVEAPDRHHFDVIDDLSDPHSSMIQRALQSAGHVLPRSAALA